jgi:hypothetical protein
MTNGPSYGLRAGLLLLTVALVGGLVGFGWEFGLHEAEALPDEPSVEPALISEPHEGGTGLSDLERSIVRRATGGLPPYKDAVPQPLAADYLDPGSRIAAAWFMTRDTPEAVLGFYERALLEAGLPLVKHRYNANAGYVGYMEPHTQQLHLVSVLAQGGETTVFVSYGQVASFLESQGGQVPADLPLPANAQQPVVLTFQGEGRVRYSVMSEVQEARVEDLAAFYRKSFEERGWKLEDLTQDAADATQLMASRGDVRATAMVQQRGQGVRLYLTLDGQP